MKRIATLAAILLIAAPVTIFAGNGRAGSQSGPKGIHTPGTGQPGGVPIGTPGGQQLRDGSGAGTGGKQQKRRGQSNQNTGQQNGQGQTQNTPK